jgi:two-component system OmpR family response regulator/two-component system response regulator TctD
MNVLMSAQSVLVVSNDDQLLNQLDALLGEQTCKTDVAINASSAVSLLRATGYDFVFFDWETATVTADQFEEILQSCHDNCPVIVFSTSPDVCDLEKAFAAGADDYLCKPFSAQELLARMRAQKDQ